MGEAYAYDQNLLSNSSPVPGPSGVYPLQYPAIEVVSESDPDDCLIVGTVKPHHERTPEIITLDSDEEVINGNTIGDGEVIVHNFDNEEVEDINSAPSCSHKPRTKAQKKQFSLKKRDSSYDSDESTRSSIVVDYHSNRRRIQERSVNGHPRIIWYSDSPTNTSSSDDDSDGEWTVRREKKNYKGKKKKITNKKKELVRKKRNSKDGKRKNKTTKHWKKRFYSKHNDHVMDSDDSGPIQYPRRRKSIALNSSPEPETENRTLHDHDYPLTNPYSTNDINKIVKGRPRLRSVVIKNEPIQRSTLHHNSYLEERSSHISPSSDSSRTSKDENDCERNPESSNEQLFNKWRHQRESSNSSVDSSSRNLYDRLADLRTDQWMQRPSTSSNVTWLGRHYIDTYSSLNPVRYNLCNYTSKGNQQEGQSSTSSSSRQHKRKRSTKDKNEKRKKSS